jgi:hypothetical protein
MSSPEREDEFEAFLQRLRREAMSGDDKLEPPSALDEIVLKKARVAIHAQQQPTRAARWAAPVALAATILLCLSVLLNVTLNTNRPDAALRRMTAGNGTEMSAPSAPLRDDAAAPQAPAGNSGPPLPAEPPPSAYVEERKPALAARSRSGHLAQAQAPSQARGPAAPTVSAPATPAARDAPSSEAAPASLAANSAPDVSQPEAAAAARESARAAPEAPPPAALTSTREPAAMALAKRKADKAAPHPQDPKVWLRQIDVLRAQGKTAQADAEMQRFRAAFPNYPAKPAAAADSQQR